MLERFVEFLEARRRENRLVYVVRVVEIAEQNDATPTRTSLRALFSWGDDAVDEALDLAVDIGVLEAAYTDVGAIYATTAITRAWVATR